VTGRTHDLAAITALGAVVLFEPLPTISLSTALMALLANQIGGIAPDIDQPTAPFWRNLPIGGFFGRIFDRVLGGHRFLTHSLLGVALFGLVVHLGLQFVQPLLGQINIGYVWWAFMIGLVSHLILDSFTKEGVPWLLPIPVKFGLPPLKSLRLTTGKKFETLIIFPLLVGLAAWLCASHYQQLLILIHSHIK
jgi:inner membrane protein